MKHWFKFILYFTLLIAGSASFITYVFLVDAPNGTFGFMLCAACINATVWGLYGVCKYTNSTKSVFLCFIEFMLNVLLG